MVAERRKEEPSSVPKADDNEWKSFTETPEAPLQPVQTLLGGWGAEVTQSELSSSCINNNPRRQRPHMQTRVGPCPPPDN